jgi:hypothetical protein
MKTIKTLSVLAASAAVALGASSAKAVDTTGYLAITISGTVVEGFTAPNTAGTQQIYTSKSTAVNNKGVLSLLYSWYAADGNTAVTGGFLTGGYKLAVLWDYTTQQLATGPEAGDIVVLDKNGDLVYDPTASEDAEAHTFTIGMNWDTAAITSGKTAILPGTSLNEYNDNQGAGTLNYEMTGQFSLVDDETAGSDSVAVADLFGSGKCLGISTFGATGLQTKVGFSFEAYGSAETYKEGTTTGTSTAVVDLKFAGGATPNLPVSTPTGTVPF